MIITCKLKQIRNLGNFNSDQYEIEAQDSVRHGETENEAYARIQGFVNDKMNCYLLKLANSVDIGLFISEVKRLLRYFKTESNIEELVKVLKDNNYELKKLNEYQIPDILKIKNIIRKLILDIENRVEAEEDVIE